MSKYASILARAKITVTDLTGLTGLSRPTLTKLVKGEGSCWQIKQDALLDTMKKIAAGVRHKNLPITRIRSETQAARLVRLQQAMTLAASAEKVRKAEEKADDAPEPTASND